jgi:hypothetical protein
MPAPPHEKLAADTWRLICALGEIDSRDEEFHDAARNIIEIACDSAVEATRAVPAQPYIVCPRCGAVSHHPKDISERYCGRCHRFHDETQP